jgi:uncharacterized BrkB/YihY/UPF0761 family membrane protein
MAGMALRILFSFLATAAAFVIAFLAIFVPLLISDIHHAPHDGQNGLGGFVLGVPLAAVVALGAGAYYYYLANRRRWFSK